MHRARSYCFGKDNLCCRKLERHTWHPTDGRKPGVNFQNKMRQSARRIALSYVADPFAKDRSVNQSVAPKRFPDKWTAPDQRAQRIMRNETKHTVAQRDHVMVQH